MLFCVRIDERISLVSGIISTQINAQINFERSTRLGTLNKKGKRNVEKQQQQQNIKQKWAERKKINKRSCTVYSRTITTIYREKNWQWKRTVAVSTAALGTNRKYCEKITKVQKWNKINKQYCRSIEQQQQQQQMQHHKKKVPARISCLEKCNSNRNGNHSTLNELKKRTQYTKDQTTKYYRSCVYIYTIFGECVRFEKPFFKWIQFYVSVYNKKLNFDAFDVCSAAFSFRQNSFSFPKICIWEVCLLCAAEE